MYIYIVLSALGTPMGAEIPKINKYTDALNVSVFFSRQNVNGERQLLYDFPWTNVGKLVFVVSTKPLKFCPLWVRILATWKCAAYILRTERHGFGSPPPLFFPGLNAAN